MALDMELLKGYRQIVRRYHILYCLGTIWDEHMKQLTVKILGTIGHCAAPFSNKRPFVCSSVRTNRLTDFLDLSFGTQGQEVIVEHLIVVMILQYG